jgi:hypothetical protein
MPFGVMVAEVHGRGSVRVFGVVAAGRFLSLSKDFDPMHSCRVERHRDELAVRFVINRSGNPAASSDQWLTRPDLDDVAWPCV